MYTGVFDRLIEATFHEIRRGAMISQPPADTPQAAGAPGVSGFLKPLRIFRIPRQEQ